MTAEKRRIINEIKERSNWIAADMELGCGFAPEGAYDSEFQKIAELEDQLARLQGFENAQEKYYWIEQNVLPKLGGYGFPFKWL